MSDYVAPLGLQQIFVNTFAGSADYFVAIAVLAIIALSAVFRMTGLTMGIMLFVFILMFSGVIPSSLLIFIAIIGGLVLGYVISRIVK